LIIHFSSGTHIERCIKTIEVQSYLEIEILVIDGQLARSSAKHRERRPDTAIRRSEHRIFKKQIISAPARVTVSLF
jgi:hypothetical protein